MPSRPVAFIKLSGQERGSGRPRRGGNCRQWGFGFLFTASPGGSFWQVFVFSGRPRSVFPVYLLDLSKNLFFYKFCIIHHRFSTEIFFLSGESSGMKSPLFPPLTVSRFSIFSCPGNSLPVSSSPRLQPEYPLRVHLSSPPAGVGFPTPAGGEVQHPWPEVSDRGGSGRKAAQSLFPPLRRREDIFCRLRSKSRPKPPVLR